MPIESLEALLEDELRDLYDAEKQLTKALPKMAKASSDEELKEAFTEHLEQTKGHVSRLEQVFENLGIKPRGKACAGMKGLIEEGSENMGQDAGEPFKDLMLIGAAQRVEHYEIAGYGTIRALADAIGNDDVVGLLEETLNEEKETDEKLTEIAERIMQDIQAGGEEEAEEAQPDREKKTMTGRTGR